MKTNGEIIIDRNIPIPRTQGEMRRLEAEKESAILKTMSIGESVFFAWEQEVGAANRLRNHIGARIRYAMPARFIVRVWPTDEPKGFRVWRTR